MQQDHLGDTDGAVITSDDSTGRILVGLVEVGRRLVGKAVTGDNVVRPPSAAAIASEQTRQHPFVISKQST